MSGAPTDRRGHPRPKVATVIALAALWSATVAGPAPGAAASAPAASPAQPAAAPQAPPAPGGTDGSDAGGSATAPDRYCPVCGARNRAAARFCVKDGTPLPPVDLVRRRPGFVRGPETYSPEEIQQVMQRVSRSVVRIRVKTTSTYKYPVAYWNDELAELFGLAMIGKLETSEIDARLSGSGFVISEGGGIVTNAHVARPDGMQAELTVETLDGRTFPARVIGSDAASDLALLKIDTDAIPPLEWGDSNAIKVGQETWAVGNPLDIGISITRGTISGIVGTRIGLNQVEAFLHSDAHITHGSSGGPLVDVLGRVLGVSDMVISETKGQGFSIPSRMARLVVDRLSHNGRYERGFVGLHVRPVDSDSTARYSLTRPEGVVVEWVIPGSAAERAGFQQGDVLYGINGKQVVGSYLLQEAISSVGPSAPITLMVDRKGQALGLRVVTTLRPEAPRIDPLQDLENYMRIKFEMDPKGHYVVVRRPHRTLRAPGLYEGARIKSVLPAQDWPDEPITPAYYKNRAKPAVLNSLEDLRTALKRAYVGGRVAVAFGTDDASNPVAAVAFDELWPIVY